MKHYNIQLIVFGYFILNTIYLLAPCYNPTDLNIPNCMVFWGNFYSIIIYLFMIGLAYGYMKKCNLPCDRNTLKASIVYNATFVIYCVFLCTKSLPTYISFCNSRLGSYLFAFFILFLSITYSFKKT